MRKLLSMEKRNNEIKCQTKLWGYVVINKQTSCQKKHGISPNDLFLFSLNLMPGDKVIATIGMELAIYYNSDGSPVSAEFLVDDLVFNEIGEKKSIHLNTPWKEDFWDYFVPGWVEVVMDQCDICYIPCFPTFKLYETWESMEAPEFHWKSGKWTRIKEE